MNLDFKKYQRIFAFGCSFTGYSWPTWADLIAYEAPHTEYFNHATPGSGNLLISLRIAEANKRYKFCETDLVMIMWSTFCREDRWVDGKWLTQGNIWNSNLYSDKWVKEFADPLGYLIRDHALINSSIGFINSLPCDNLLLKSNSFDKTEFELASTEKESIYYRDMALLYRNDYNMMPQSLYEYLGAWDACEQIYFDDLGTQEMRHDSHPHTSIYADYLKQIGVTLSDSTHEWAAEADAKLKRSKTRSEINREFSYLSERLSKNFKQLF